MQSALVGRVRMSGNVAVGEFMHRRIKNLQLIGCVGLEDTKSSSLLSKVPLLLVYAAEILLEARRVHWITQAKPSKHICCLKSEFIYFSCAL